MSFEILNNYSDVKYYKVTDKELSALKQGAELMEMAREFFNAGPGNQRSCHIGSNGEAYLRWRKARALTSMTLNQASKDYIKYFSRHIKPTSKKPAEKAVTDLVVGFSAAYYVKGGNCAENADMMAFLAIANGGLAEHYRRLHRVWLVKAGHEITVLESTNGSSRPILLDPWIPASQACLLEHSKWSVALKRYKPDWTIDIADENKFGLPFVRGLMTHADTEGKRLVEDSAYIQKIETEGESAWVTRECPDCNKKWGTAHLLSDENGEKCLCPNCKKGKVHPITGKYEKYKPPYHQNIEAMKNLGIHLYGNIGIIREKIAHDEKGRAVIPYTLNERPAEDDMNYWKTHHKRMRTYIWGQVE